MVALQVVQPSNENDDGIIDASAEVADILGEFFPDGLVSATAEAMAAGRGTRIDRDAANEDVAREAVAV
jgi:hypothetical protein